MEYFLLICAGIIVGVINTFAGAGASISLALYTFMGVDLPVANATNRVSVLAQTITMSGEFLRQGKLDYRVGLLLSIPTIIGSVVGSLCVGMLSSKLFAVVLCGILFFMLLVLIFNPTKALRTKSNHTAPKWYHYALLLLIGFYGGAFHIGIGYLFLWLFIMGLGYDYIEANALKGFVVLPYTIFSLGVFVFTEEVLWVYGLVHGVGNIIGTYFAARYSQYIPIKILRVGLIIFIIFTLFYIIHTKL